MSTYNSENTPSHKHTLLDLRPDTPEREIYDRSFTTLITAAAIAGQWDGECSFTVLSTEAVSVSGICSL